MGIGAAMIKPWRKSKLWVREKQNFSLFFPSSNRRFVRSGGDDGKRKRRGVVRQRGNEAIAYSLGNAKIKVSRIDNTLQSSLRKRCRLCINTESIRWIESVMHFLNLFIKAMLLLSFLASFTAWDVSGAPASATAGAGAVNPTNIAIAPSRKCKPPQKMDASGNCKSPW